MKNEITKNLDCMSPQFVVSNLEDSIRFYTEQLGFDLNFRYEDFYAGLGCNGHSIHLKCGEVFNSERENKRKSEHLDVTFGVLDIDEVYESICSKKVDVVQPLRTMPYGREFYISDLDGYLIGFFWSE